MWTNRPVLHCSPWLDVEKRAGRVLKKLLRNSPVVPFTWLLWSTIWLAQNGHSGEQPARGLSLSDPAPKPLSPAHQRFLKPLLPPKELVSSSRSTAGEKSPTVNLEIPVPFHSLYPLVLRSLVSKGGGKKSSVCLKSSRVATSPPLPLQRRQNWAFWNLISRSCRGRKGGEMRGWSLGSAGSSPQDRCLTSLV